MPIYEYRCTSCDAALEKLQKISDSPLIDCPECGKATLQKLVSASSFRLKGSGWYETDFKNNNKSAAGADKNTATSKSTENKASDSGAAKESAKTASDSGNKDSSASAA